MDLIHILQYPIITVYSAQSGANNMRKRDNINENEMLSARKKSTIKTTLYELIKLVNEEIRPGEEKLVPVIVNQILETEQSVKWIH